MLFILTASFIAFVTVSSAPCDTDDFTKEITLRYGAGVDVPEGNMASGMFNNIVKYL